MAAHLRQETGPRLSSGADTRVVVSFGAHDTTIQEGVRRVEAERSCRALDDSSCIDSSMVGDGSHMWAATVEAPERGSVRL